MMPASFSAEFGELLRLTLRVMNTLTVDDLRSAVVFLQQFR
jgi:hypothetical protein